MARPESPPFESTSSSTRRHAIGDHLRAVARNQKDVFQRRHGGESTPRPSRQWYACRRWPGCLPSPRTALAVLTGLNLLNYLDRYIPFAVLPVVSAALHLSDTQAGLLQTLFIGIYIAGVARRRLAGRPAQPLRHRGDRRARLERRHLRLGPGACVRGAGAGARADRRRRSELPVVTPSLMSDFYPARPSRPRAGDLLRGDPGRHRRRLHRGRRRSEAHFGWRAAFFIAGGPGAAAGARVLLAFRDPPAGALRRDGRASAEP